MRLRPLDPSGRGAALRCLLRPLVLDLPDPRQHLFGGHDVSELLNDVFQRAPMLTKPVDSKKLVHLLRGCLQAR